MPTSARLPKNGSPGGRGAGASGRATPSGRDAAANAAQKINILTQRGEPREGVLRPSPPRRAAALNTASLLARRCSLSSYRARKFDAGEPRWPTNCDRTAMSTCWNLLTPPGENSTPLRAQCCKRSGWVLSHTPMRWRISRYVCYRCAALDTAPLLACRSRTQKTLED
ncbi:hypothetical protein T492DRAFT_233853 [Pavlovales sp. CCMP2436]|nr:hypothetical protein T492DRAFT_233853 [Pavlovales sp. CCMP2436]